MNGKTIGIGCVTLAQAIKENEGLFSMGFVLRYAPLYRRIAELITEGVLGELISFEFNETLRPCHGGFIMGEWRRKREWAGPYLLEKCCHDFDLANWITGSLPVAILEYANGFLAESLRNSMITGAVPEVGLNAGIRSAVACFGVDAALGTELSSICMKCGNGSESLRRAVQS